ncbi:MAG: hypothetical protein MPW16_06070 [Candidatus Manganitrophus sp.]|nr:MAG: hypothetical protein MPW16_06070 [Candidatus Manganitrophus sp.]
MKKEKLILYTAVLLVLLAVVEFFLVHKHHAVFALENFPGYTAVFGLLATVVLILVSKGIGHSVLMVREDYYENPAADTPHEGEAHHD